MSNPLLDAVPISDINCTKILLRDAEHDPETLKNDEVSTSDPQSPIDGHEKDSNESQIEEIYPSSGNGEIETYPNEIMSIENNDISTSSPEDDKNKSHAFP